MTPAEALRLLGSVPYGRVVFTHKALPAIRPVNHIVDDQRVVFRTGASAAITSATGSDPGTIVAFEADAIDAVGSTGWSVVIIGPAHRLDDPAEIRRYHQLLNPWAAIAGDDVIVVQADLVTGYRLPGGQTEAPSG